jgi:hypothetical protein
VNSWGTDWGALGHAWVPYTQLATSIFDRSKILRQATRMEFRPTPAETPNLVVAPANLVASAAGAGAPNTYYVTLHWDPVEFAQGYAVQRLEQRPAGEFGGTIDVWHLVADLGPDVFHYMDMDVAPGSVHRYRAQGLWSLDPRIESPNIAEVQGSASELPGGVPGGILLTATGASADASLPDRVQLEWNAVPGDVRYLVLRTDQEEGLRGGRFIVIADLEGETRYEDDLDAGDRYSYRVFALDRGTGAIVGSSQPAVGQTSGRLGGQDLLLLEIDFPASPLPLPPFAGSVAVANVGPDVSRGRRVRLGVEWWVEPVGTGTPTPIRIVTFRENANNPVSPLLPEAVSTSDLAPGDTESLLFPSVPRPVWGAPFATLAGWWFAVVEPLDEGGNPVEDVDPTDNEDTHPDIAVLGVGGMVSAKPR